MEELLLPGAEEEARSDHSSYVPGDEEKTMWGRAKTFLRVTVKGELWGTVRNFLKRNGLLTLSVIAVLTGCTLGFMLRGTQLSTQVRPTCWTGRGAPVPVHVGATSTQNWTGHFDLLLIKQFVGRSWSSSGTIPGQFGLVMLSAGSHT